MTFDPKDYPTLQALFRGYLHQDYTAEHGSAAAAVAAFRADASVGELHALDQEWRRFHGVMRDRPWTEILAALSQLGAAWAPPDFAALSHAMSSGG